MGLKQNQGVYKAHFDPFTRKKGNEEKNTCRTFYGVRYTARLLGFTMNAIRKRIARDTIIYALINDRPFIEDKVIEAEKNKGLLLKFRINGIDVYGKDNAIKVMCGFKTGHFEVSSEEINTRYMTPEKMFEVLDIEPYYVIVYPATEHHLYDFTHEVPDLDKYKDGRVLDFYNIEKELAIYFPATDEEFEQIKQGILNLNLNKSKLSNYLQRKLYRVVS